MKKRILLGIPAFFIAFLFSYLIVPEFHTVLPTAHSAVPSTESEAVQLPVSTAPEVKSKDFFVPEFTDLPEFSELDDNIDSNNLIDIFEMDGIYRKSEVVTENGETWLTLIERNGMYSLVRARAKVKNERTFSYSDGEPQVRLTFDKPGTPIFATKNLRALEPGPVTTLYHRPFGNEIERRNLPIESMHTGYNRSFQLVGEELQDILRVSKGLTKSGQKVGILVLEQGPVMQVIAENYDENIGELYWVGDLDNDGKLDLYIEQDDEIGGFSSKLYLSSVAGEGRLVKLVATFGTAGC